MAQVFPVSNEIRAYFKNNYMAEDANALQEIISYLKNAGCSQMQTVFLLIEEAAFSFKDANLAVMHSNAWNA